MTKKEIINHPAKLSARELFRALLERVVTFEELTKAGELDDFALECLREFEKETVGRNLTLDVVDALIQKYEHALLESYERLASHKVEARLISFMKMYVDRELEARNLPADIDSIVLRYLVGNYFEQCLSISISVDQTISNVPLKILPSEIAERMYEKAAETVSESCNRYLNLAEHEFRMTKMTGAYVESHSDHALINDLGKSTKRIEILPNKMNYVPALPESKSSFQSALSKALSRIKRSLLGHSRMDENSAALYAPRAVPPGHKFRVQVHLYDESQASEIEKKAKTIDHYVQLMDSNPLPGNLTKGTRVTVSLSLDNESAYAGKRTTVITWSGRPVSVQFFVKAACPEGEELVGVVTLSIDGAPIGELSFMTLVSKSVDDDPATVHRRFFSKVFISYAHEDEKTAAAMATAYRAHGIPYFFDRHNLESGSLFNEEIMQSIEDSDLFLLLWSQNAEKSAYVEKEYLHAIQFAYPQKDKQLATLTFRPYFVEPVADPPAKLKSLYNFSRLLIEH